MLCALRKESAATDPHREDRGEQDYEDQDYEDQLVVASAIEGEWGSDPTFDIFFITFNRPAHRCIADAKVRTDLFERKGSDSLFEPR